jgi:hypothetical protein
MSSDWTVRQGGAEQLRSQEMSLRRGYPPAAVPGYELDRLLGVGAYGEVWVAVERNTGRRVAIKYYAHRGGLDWTLLSREVEKLAFLFADRYVVQLIGVGWEAEPPYYIMEYLEQGSLAERLQRGPLSVHEAVEMFREVAVGLVHAHGKGVLHCDLKPANVLLDQDQKPRLADFGQSRLSHEQLPALGTLYYMAPEQADLDAVPHVQWDVYALGALLYCMLCGHPPYRGMHALEPIDPNSRLQDRLSQYRRLLRKSPRPSEHRQVRGVDRALAEILDGCLATNPQKRYPNVEAVLEALRVRASRRARRPLMVLGAVGPMLLLAAVSMFAWWGFGEAIRQSTAALTQQALESDRFAAQFVARSAANQLEVRWRMVEQIAANPRLRQLVAELTADSEIRKQLTQLSNPEATTIELEQWQYRFRENAQRQKLQDELQALLKAHPQPEVYSWFLTDARGVQMANLPADAEIPTIGKNFSWRSYFNGQGKDLSDTWRPGPTEHITDTTLSVVYRSRSNHRWMVAISTPVFDRPSHDEFLGVIGMSLELGRFLELRGKDQVADGDHQFPVLVDWRDGENKGVILQHPLFDRLIAQQGAIPDHCKDLRLMSRDLPRGGSRMENYHDPISDDPEGTDYQRQWLAQMEPVVMHGQDTGWIVIVQEAYDRAIGAPLAGLKSELLRWGVATAVMMGLLLAGLWTLAFRMLQQATPQRALALANLSEHATPGPVGRGGDDSSGASAFAGAGSTSAPKEADALPADNPTEAFPQAGDS